MSETGADFTRTFRALSILKISDDKVIDEESRIALINEIVENCCYSVEAWKLSSGGGENSQEMKMLKMMLRHGMLSAADQTRVRQMIEEQESKLDFLNMSDEEKKIKDRSKWSDFVDLYVERLRKENQIDKNRNEKMNKSNPKYILRNYVAERVINSAENGDFQPVRDLLELLKTPYDDNVPNELESPVQDFCKLTAIDDIQLKVT